MSKTQQVARPVAVSPFIRGFYCLFACSMVLWIWHLLATIPEVRMGMHWRVMWGVFDAALFVNGLVVAYLLVKKSAWACLPLTSLGTLFIVDMWFDYMTSVTSAERLAVAKITIAAEVPLALLTYGCAVYILRMALATNDTLVISPKELDSARIVK